MYIRINLLHSLENELLTVVLASILSLSCALSLLNSIIIVLSCHRCHHVCMFPARIYGSCEKTVFYLQVTSPVVEGQRMIAVQHAE